MARFEYTSGVFAGYTYYEDSEHDITMYYSPYSILGINNFIELQGSDVFYETKTNRKLEYYGGSLIDAETRAYVVLSEEKKQELDMEKIEKQKKQAELQPLYQKYGKKYVDALFNEGKILVGAPEDLVKKHTQSTLVSETQSTRTYKIKGVFNDWASIVDVDVQTKKVIAVRNRTL